MSEEKTVSERESLLKKRLAIHPVRVARRIVQVFFFVALNAGIVGVLNEAEWFAPIAASPPIASLLSIIEYWGAVVQSYFFVLPILQTYSNPATVSTGLFSLLQIRIISGFFPFLEIGVLLITVLLVGRGFCGWVCPFGTLQDIIAKAPTKKWRIDPNLNKDLAEIKYYLLGVILVLCTWIGISTVQGTAEGLKNALGALADGPFDAISPAATIDTLFSWMIIEGVMPTLDNIVGFLSMPIFFWIRVGFLLFIVFLSMFIPRAFCRYFCPMGALAAIFSKYSFFGYTRKPHLCDKLRVCEEQCPMGIRILQEDWMQIRSRECINCGICWASCPLKAIKPTVS
ncbi:MAG: 4Fe-4S binding protein [Candidatus Ranarchaeia archaeon]